MRRQPPNEPVARSAIWTRRLAILGAGLALASIAVAHRGPAGPAVALGLLGGGLLLAGLSCAAGLAAAVVIWRTGHRGTARLLAGLAVATITLAYPAYVAATVAKAPLQSDLSTDPADPPGLSRSTRAFAARGDLSGMPRLFFDALRQPSKPDAEPILLDTDGAEAFDAVIKAVRQLRWHLVEAVAPGGRSGLGHVDATSYSSVMHLPEEIAIRIRPLAGQTRVDIRSMSHKGVPDFGDNAANLRAMTETLQDQEDDK